GIIRTSLAAPIVLTVRNGRKDRTVLIDRGRRVPTVPIGPNGTVRIVQTPTARTVLAGTAPAALTSTVRTGRIVQVGTGIGTIASSTIAGTATSGAVTGTVVIAAIGGATTAASGAGAACASASISHRATATTACRAPIGTGSTPSVSTCRTSS